MRVNDVIAAKLVGVMTELGVTVSDLSKRTGLATGTISNIRNGKNHYSWQIKLISDELGIPISTFYAEEVSVSQALAIKTILTVDNPDILLHTTNFLREYKKYGK